MMRKLSASIFIPAYNAESCILKSIKSLNLDAHPDIQVTVINDGSTDQTYKILTSLSLKNVKIVNLRKNYGLDYVYNKIFKLSTTDLTLIYHADDIYDPSIISKSIKFMSENPDLGACFSMSKHQFKFSPSKFQQAKLPYVIYEKAELLRDLSKYYNFILTPSACVRTKYIKSNSITWQNHKTNGLFNQGASGGDLSFWLELSNVAKIGFLNEFLVDWKQHKGQLSKTSKKGLKTVTDFVPVMETHINLLPESPLKSEIIQNLLLIKFKELNIAKLNSILGCDYRSLSQINGEIRAIALKFILAIFTKKWVLNKYYKYLILSILLMMPYVIFERLFLYIKNKNFSEY